MIRLSAFADEISKDLSTQIRVLKEHDVYLIELRSVDGVNVSEFSDEQAIAYQAQIEKEGLSVWSIGSPLGKVDIQVDFTEYEKTVRRVCRLATIFKTDKIRIFSFFNAYEEKEKVFDYLRKMVKIAQEYGVELYHENEKDIYGDTLARVEEVLENVPGLKCIYDPVNYLQVGEEPTKTLAAMAARTGYFHIKDAVKETGELVPAGYGDGGIKELVASVNADMVLTLEPHLTIFEGYAQIDATELKNKFHFDSNEEAFGMAAVSLKKILAECGYQEKKGVFIK